MNRNLDDTLQNKYKPELVHQDTSWCPADSSATVDWMMVALS